MPSKPTAAAEALPPTPANIARGIAAFCLSALLFSAMYAVVKHLGHKFPTIQVQFFRGLIALLLMMPIFAIQGFDLMRTRRPWGHASRSLAGIASMFCTFTAFAHLPLADVTALLFAMPLFVTALSVPLLGEPVGWRRWAAVIVGFLGVLVILQPVAISGGGQIHWLYLMPLLAAFLYSLATIALRQLGATERTMTTVFYFTLSVTVVTGLLLPFNWRTPVGTEWFWLVAVGVLGGVAQIFLVMSYRFAPAAIAAPFEYTALVWTILFGIVFWQEMPTVTMLAGAGVVIAAGLFILYRETRQRARTGAAAP
ncbi:MAG: DMT family transporter [Alphaproteobacteria bacterium]